MIKGTDLHDGRSMAASEQGAADGEREALAHHRPATTAGIRAAVQNLPSRWHFLPASINCTSKTPHWG